ncbi:unnamed protein product [Peronospora farinosa]|uniref:SAP30-binding protein n=1 Tax=Peronospora farinosa TaxID=134698 RepID=A0AAV0SNH3_9STRA|nr:unnamed protein product [Peronospora farinosa]CAI5704403.1 unnamed protein product [Peronospora farinosa]
MNSLGLEYGSSSSDEEDVTSPPKTQTQSLADPSSLPSPSPAVSSVVTPASKVSANPNEASTAQPEENVAAQAIEFAATPTGPNVSMSNGDEETMLLQAGIPPAASPLDADNETQQRIERFLRVQHERGQDFQTTLQDKKEVRNPYILEKVVEYFGINELQSNFPPNKFDPHGLPLHEYVDVLAMEQKKRADVRAQRQLQQQRDGVDPRQLQFISANALS